jgi:hypothetical protein
MQTLSACLFAVPVAFKLRMSIPVYVCIQVVAIGSPPIVGGEGMRTDRWSGGAKVVCKAMEDFALFRLLVLDEDSDNL